MPILAVDIDECLASYCDAFLPFMEKRGISIKKEDIKGSFTDMGVDPQYFDEFAQSGALKHLKPVPWAFYATRRLANYFELVAVTSRPPEHAAVTEAWMGEHFPHIARITHTSNKGAYCKQVNAWGLVDDSIQFAKQVENAYVLAASWNAEWEGCRGNWLEILSWILEKRLKEIELV